MATAIATIVLNQSLDKLEVDFTVDVSSFNDFTMVLYHAETATSTLITDCLLTATSTAIYKPILVNVFNKAGTWKIYGKASDGTREIQSYESFIITVVNPGGI